ncbi:uncharacterized protein [Anabrus simplex]|uniref:uncharacterized protein isoform X2 n=1 Tax=Anabrus simplex TaxID=316456 RepID=UPI0035A349B0
MGDRNKKNKKLARKEKGKLSSAPEEAEAIAMGKPRSDTSPCGSRDAAKETKRKRPVRERFLLTRKTWRYMADAGRRLIPDGAHNRPEDIPKIEAYFQEVCQREPRFLLWRKSSYPGALGFRSHYRKNRRKKGGSCREKASSADEAEDTSPKGAFVLSPTGAGRFDLHRLRQEFLHGKSPSDSPSTSKTISSPSGSPSLHTQRLATYGNVASSGAAGVPSIYVGPVSEEDEKQEFIETLLSYLNEQEDEGGAGVASHSSIDFQALLDQLRKHLSNLSISSDTSYPDETYPTSTTGHEFSSGSTAHHHQHLQSSYRGMEGIPFTGDHQQKLLLETLRRYYSKSTSREKVISDLLTDRKMLEKLYFDLRKTRGFSGRRSGSGTGSQQSRDSTFGPLLRRRDGVYRHDNIDEDIGNDHDASSSLKRPSRFHLRRSHRDVSPFSPPPLIEVQNETEVSSVDVGTQTPVVPPSMFAIISEFLRKEREKDVEGKEDSDVVKDRAGARRRSSVDHDDVSPSVSDTIKRYLRMARKKSLDSDKVDRFKRVNYDRNLRNIKAKGEITKPGDDDGLNKGAQTDESWVDAMKELKISDLTDSISRVPSSRSSIDEGDSCGSGLLSPTHGVVHHHKGLLSTGQTFLSNLLHGLQQGSTSSTETISGTGASCVPTAAAAMQKSKSSSSVVQHGGRLMAKKLWRARSKSQGRTTASAPCSWTPQGRCTWTSVSGRTVTLTDTSLLQLSEPEAQVLHQVALAKLQALNLGVTIRVPSEVTGAVVHKPKRRPYLLKRKALTTGFFDTARGKEAADKEKGCGLVFGIPLAQCVENDRMRSPRGRSDLSGDEALDLRRKSHHGSRSSFSSLIETGRPEESGSCESLMVGSVPGLLDTLSCDSAVDADYEPAVPQIVSSCFRYLEIYGINTLGLFRVSSSKKRARQLREDFDCGKEIVFGEDTCPHDVATLLKEFFRDLPEPLLSRDLYHAFMQTQRIRNRRLQYEALQHLVQLLPAANRDTLHALLTFLANVAAHSTDFRNHNGEWVPGNKMDSNNLATVFAPNVLHCIKPGSTKEMTSERAEERIDVINVVRTMIDHNKNLFHVSAELLDEVYVHMMDSHPDVLDQLLSKRDASNDETLDDHESNRTEGTCSSDVVADQDEQQQHNIVRRVWSREEFLHETAGMGGPDMAMRPSSRHRDRERVRERSSKKRWCEEPATGRRSNMDQRPSEQEERSSPDTSGGGIITASLKIPVPSAINFEDTDSPFMEDSSYSIATVDASRQQMTIGIVCSGSTNAPRRRRQRSASGSDSSQASTTTAGPSQATQYQVVGGYDSALGSSATFSSPPRNTTPSICSSSGGEAGLHSSPPSWASSPPTSPDANLSSINFIPDDINTFPTANQAQNTKMSIATKGATVSQLMQLKGSSSIVTAKEVAPVILQKVTFTSTSELRQVHRTGNTESVHTASTSNENQVEQVQSTILRTTPKVVHSPQKLSTSKDLPKSASISSVVSPSPPPSPATRKLAVSEEVEYIPDRKYTTSISSIGGAVMRSKTADIERMLRIQRTEITSATRGGQAKQETPRSVQEQNEDKKKYTKRRYTDYRHQTRQIPDAEALNEATSSEQSDTTRTPATVQHRNQGPVWKRRELIASDPKEHETFP